MARLALKLQDTGLSLRTRREVHTLAKLGAEDATHLDVKVCELRNRKRFFTRKLARGGSDHASRRLVAEGLTVQIS